jgi:hypothetical protein
MELRGRALAASPSADLAQHVGAQVVSLGDPFGFAGGAVVAPQVVIDAYDPIGGVGVLRSADHGDSVARAYAESPGIPLPVHMRSEYSVHMHKWAANSELTAIDTKRFRVYITRDGGYVGEGMTDGEAYWLVNTHGDRISEFLCNRAQVTIAANRLFGRMCSWDVMQYGHPAWDMQDAYPDTIEEGAA